MEPWQPEPAPDLRPNIYVQGPTSSLAADAVADIPVEPQTGTSRHQQTELLRTSSMAWSQSTEFRPDLARRSEIWELQRKLHIEQLRRSAEAKELAECSFRPSVSGSSSNDTKPKPKALNRSSSEALAQRLCRPLPSEPRRALEIAYEKRGREVRELEECTFAPNLARSFSSRQLSLRSPLLQEPITQTARGEVIEADAKEGKAYDQPIRRRASSVNSDELTGHPQTNAVPSYMCKAQNYIRQNVFDRLSQPRPSAHDGSVASGGDEAGGAGSSSSSFFRSPHSSRMDMEEAQLHGTNTVLSEAMKDAGKKVSERSEAAESDRQSWQASSLPYRSSSGFSLSCCCCFCCCCCSCCWCCCCCCAVFLLLLLFLLSMSHCLVEAAAFSHFLFMF